MKIVSVDPGTRNMGLAVYENGKITHFNCYCLFDYIKKKKEKTDYALMTHNFIAAHPEIFNNVDKVLIEVQMQARMKLVCNTLRCLHWKQAVKISPLAVKNFFGSSKGKHSKNKKAAIELVAKFLNDKQMKQLKKHKKKDDCADAIIQIYYYLQKNNI